MSLRGNKCIGILREVKNKWERRVPLTPLHVKELVSQGIEVLIQPSTRRIFVDEEYRRVGATVQDDISAASVILGVKEVPIANLINDRTYVFFSHTIKAQPENMPLLDALLAKNIRLLDYECIVADGQRGGKRLVAFGKYAGIAGMIDTLRGVGERLLATGYGTPFLGVGSTYMYPDLQAARAAVSACGDSIASNGLPPPITPLTFAFTGSGNVSEGARDIFSLLPHEMVAPEDLPRLVNGGDADLNKVYGTIVSSEHMVAPPADGAPFDKAAYYRNPSAFTPVFHETIAPYTSVLMNCMYWNAQFPRLLTTQQAAQLRASGNKRLLAVGDVSCDVSGSVELLQRITTIEQPFYLHDPATGLIHTDLDQDGVLMMGVDNLPAELPRDASTHFGDALLPLIPALAASNGELPWERQSDLPPSLRGACITNAGELTPAFSYIEPLRRDNERIAAASGDGGDGAAGSVLSLLLRGHLFDFSLINRVLDLVEGSDCTVRMVDWKLGSTRDDPTSAVLELRGSDDDAVSRVHEAMSVLVAALSPMADTSLTQLSRENLEQVLSSGSDSDTTSASASSPSPPLLPASLLSLPPKRVLILGSGLVSGPVVDYLHRIPSLSLTIASADEAEAQQRARGRERITTTPLDVSVQQERVAAMIAEHDLVISLVPAPFHAPIAKACIAARTHMVTASYVSPALQALSDSAAAAGITILNEVGVDPGIDHMTAMATIHEVQASGGAIESFTSLCGGLPAPEASDNPLGYKFSWNPAGVLSASQNPARFKLQGKEYTVPGSSLLASARPVTLRGPGLSLEQLPNRDSLPYAAAYGIQDSAHTVYRGTLRYAGFSAVMAAAADLGLLSSEPLPQPQPQSWQELTRSLLPDTSQSPGDSIAQRLQLLAGDGSGEEARRIVDGLRYIGVFDGPESGSPQGATLSEALCQRLQSRLVYGDGERDMLLMHHKFGVLNADGSRETRTTTLQEYGVPHGDSAMATTVGLPTAIGAALLLAGRIQRKGVCIPVHADIYSPMLQLLQAEGITVQETVTPEPAQQQ